MTKLFYFLSFLFLFGFTALAQPSMFFSHGVGGGGALFYPTINPGNDNEFYVACDMSQLFHSQNFGLHYDQVHFSKLQVFGNSTYEFTNDNNIAYSIYNDGNAGYPVKTIDGGQTWNVLSGNPDPTEQVYTLRADYYHPNRIVMGYYGQIHFSDDGGTTFSLVKNAANNGAGLRIAGVFFEGDNIYIGTNDGLIVSTNGGASFSVLATTGMPATETILAFAGAKSGNTTRFFCIAGNVADIYNGLFPWDYYGMLKNVYSLDFGTNVWTPKMNGINPASDYCMYMGMAWNDINTVYIGGTDGNLNANNVLKTTNAGTSWSKVFLTNNNQNIITGHAGYQGDKQWSYGETCFGITVAPLNANKVIFGDFGYVHLTDNGGTSWRQAYTAAADQHLAGAPTPKYQYYHSVELENTTTWQVHWSDATNMFAAFSDIGGIRSKNGGTTWGFDYTGHTANSMYRIAANPTGTLFAGTSNIHDMYQSTRLQDAQLDAADGNGKIIYSTDKGQTWTDMHNFGHPVFWVAIDPNNANKMYASVIHYGGGSGQGGIWMTNNASSLAAATWTKLPNPPRTEGHPAAIIVLNDGKVLCTYSGRRGATGFTASSGAFIYNGSTWSDVSDAGMYYWTKDIILDPTDANQNSWYACVFSGWGGAPNGLGGLYKTTNRGLSWTKLTGSQFDRVTSLTFNPQNTKQAYMTTETNGLWISNSMDAATPTWTLVTSYPFRQPERVFFNPYNQNVIWVTSFGNGLKSGNITTSGIDFAENEKAKFMLYPNPTKNRLSIDIQANLSETNEISLLDITGKKIANYSIHKGQNTYYLDIASLPAGMYLIQIGNETQKWMKE